MEERRIRFLSKTRRHHGRTGTNEVNSKKGIDKRNTCFLPDDIKNFYLTTDGFYLHWSVKMDNGPMPIGRLHINRINQLVRIGGSNSTSHVNPTLQDLENDSDHENEVPELCTLV
ncbi:hypothetical protein KUTeg_018112 [Tegillarca granosa]|uniref:Uncharacterized protein n=1 Tax=Tegillarca granosa TaxID=220873 RepID=A0ABQ9EID2_TEGGR|nr:hypothetical protein KUTeg_018112 [Tegillarca granosa]